MGKTITIYLKRYLAFFAELEFVKLPSGSLDLSSKNFILIEQNDNSYNPQLQKDRKSLVAVKCHVIKYKKHTAKAIMQYLKEKFDNTFMLFMRFATKTKTITEAIFAFIDEFHLESVTTFDALKKKYYRKKSF